MIGGNIRGSRVSLPDFSSFDHFFCITHGCHERFAFYEACYLHLHPHVFRLVSQASVPYDFRHLQMVRPVISTLMLRLITILLDAGRHMRHAVPSRCLCWVDFLDMGKGKVCRPFPVVIGQELCVFLGLPYATI